MRETMKFKPGNTEDSLVSEVPLSAFHEQHAFDENTRKYYGGYLVAESVPPELRSLLAVAPDLLGACVKTADELEALADKHTHTCHALAVKLSAAAMRLRTVIAKAG